MPKKLTPKEELFCREYLIDFNGTSAAERSGYSAKSYEALRQQASQLLTKPHIAQRLSQLMAARSRRTGINADRVLLELSRIAFVNFGDFIKDGSVQIPNNLDDLAAIAEIDEKITIDGEGNQRSTYKIKLCDKIKALSLLMKHLGMLNDFDMAITCLREKYGLSIIRDDRGVWEIVDLSKIAVQ
ncbi:MAG: terminase small subunit [Cyanobacteria bacterium J06633_8]